MKRTYLFLTIIGFLLPNYFTIKESIASGNILFYADPLATFNGMFANNYSSAFAIDLLFIVALFLVWSYWESKKYKLKNIGFIWLFTFAFGIASGLPLFLLVREMKKQSKQNNYV